MSRIELEESPLLQVRGFAPREMGRRIDRGKRFSPDDIMELATPGTELNVLGNELMDRHQFLVGEVMPRNYDKVFSGSKVIRAITNRRDKLNVLLHSDMENFFLFANERGRKQDMDICPRPEGVSTFFQTVREFAPRIAQFHAEDEQRVNGFIGRGFLYRFHTGYPLGWGDTDYMDPVKRDPVAHNILMINDYISQKVSHGGVSDEIAFKMNRRGSELLADMGALYKHRWTPYSVVFMSRKAFHQRACNTVKDISAHDGELYTARNLYTYPDE